MENLPKVDMKDVGDILDEIKELAENKQLAQWIDKNLETLSKENPALYYLISSRAKFTALGLSQTPERCELGNLLLSISFELLILLKVIDKSYLRGKDKAVFVSMMEKLFKGEDLKEL